MVPQILNFWLASVTCWLSSVLLLYLLKDTEQKCAFYEHKTLPFLTHLASMHMVPQILHFWLEESPFIFPCLSISMFSLYKSLNVMSYCLCQGANSQVDVPSLAMPPIITHMHVLPYNIHINVI